MIGFYGAPLGAGTLSMIFGAGRRHDPGRRRILWRILYSAAAIAAAGGVSLVAAWVTCRTDDARGALVASLSAMASAAAVLLWTRPPPVSRATPICRPDAPSEFADVLDGADAIDAQVVETALRQAEKMETIGRCVSEFVHDFNNLLTVIICNLDRAARSAAPGTKAFEHLADAALASERAACLAADILAFSRRQPPAEQLVDIDCLLVAMRPLIVSVANGCVVDFELGCGWLCRAEANQLENAVLNLVVNARDAMPSGGRVTLTTFGAAVGTDDPLNHAGDYVVLTVRDTGVGMAPEVASRAFDPFFTTKPAGRGTGLGLSQIAGFARRAGGSAWIDSAPGLGTRVHVFLPRIDPQAVSGPVAIDDVDRSRPNSAWPQ